MGHYEYTCFLSWSSNMNRRSIRYMTFCGSSQKLSIFLEKSSGNLISFSFIPYFIDNTIKTLYHPLMLLTLTLNGG